MASDTREEKTERDTLSDGTDEAVKLYGTGRFQIVLFGEDYRIILTDELVYKYYNVLPPKHYRTTTIALLYYHHSTTVLPP